MALRYFSNDEMVALTTTWVTPGHPDHDVLASRGVLASLLPELDAAHRGVLNSQPYETTVERLDEIRREQSTVDRRHDRLLRAIYYRGLSEQQLAAAMDDDQDILERLAELRSLIVPDGLNGTQKTYREEAGHCQRVAAQLTDAQRALLAELPTYRGTLLDCVIEWMAQGKRLGELDHERTGILPVRNGTNRGRNLRARQRWIRIVNLIRMNAELLGEDAEVAELLGRIRHAEEQRELRAARVALPSGNTDDQPGADPVVPDDGTQAA